MWDPNRLPVRGGRRRLRKQPRADVTTWRCWMAEPACRELVGDVWSGFFNFVVTLETLTTRAARSAASPNALSTSEARTAGRYGAAYQQDARYVSHMSCPTIFFSGSRTSQAVCTRNAPCCVPHTKRRPPDVSAEVPRTASERNRLVAGYVGNGFSVRPDTSGPPFTYCGRQCVPQRL